MCRQVEILNIGNNDECMVLSHFHDIIIIIK